MVINIEPIRSLSILYSALNYNGYDKENNPKGMHPLRVWVRKELSLKKIDRFNFEWHPYQYTKAVLTTDDLVPTQSTNKDFLPAIDYLNKFAQESGFDEIWPRIESETNEVLDQYRPLIKETIKKVDDCFDMDKEAKTMWFSVNLLESFLRGFSIQTKDKTVIITGPSDKPNISNLIHEYIHTYLHNQSFNNQIDDQIYSQIPQDLQNNYPREIITEECLVRAIEVFLSKHGSIPGQIELDNQAKSLLFPEIYLKKLENIKPEKISINVLQQVL